MVALPRVIKVSVDIESDNAASNSGSQKAETRGPMLDLFLAQRANMRGKQLLAVETPEEQCNPLEAVRSYKNRTTTT